MRVNILNACLDPSISGKHDCFINLAMPMQGTAGTEQHSGENSQADVILRKAG